MSWAVGYDSAWKRDIGYGVPAVCDTPGCLEDIDRGLSYVCGGEPYGGDHGCGLYFCARHLSYADGGAADGTPACGPCYLGQKQHFAPTPDVHEWVNHKLTDQSWMDWRVDNPDEVARLHLLRFDSRGLQDGGVW